MRRQDSEFDRLARRPSREGPKDPRGGEVGARRASCHDAQVPNATCDVRSVSGPMREIRPLFGRLDAVAPRCPSEGLEDIESELVAIDAHLAANGLARRIPRPTGGDTDRDRICTQLLLALKDLRGIDSAHAAAANGVRDSQWAALRARPRDQRIVDLLYRLAVPVLLVFCRARLRRSPCALDPNDVMEDVFLNLWLKCELFQERLGATFTGWALVIAENHILQLARRFHRERERVRWVAEAAPRARSTLDPVRTIATDEQFSILNRELTILLLLCADAIGRLPERALELLVLRDRDGMSYDAIAARLSVTRKHVGMNIRRARKRVLDEIADSLKRVEASEEGRRS